jgi:hypothetical protein
MLKATTNTAFFNAVIGRHYRSYIGSRDPETDPHPPACTTPCYSAAFRFLCCPTGVPRRAQCTGIGNHHGRPQGNHENNLITLLALCRGRRPPIFPAGFIIMSRTSSAHIPKVLLPTFLSRNNAAVSTMQWLTRSYRSKMSLLQL